MLRATVRRVHALGDVSVTIDGLYGSESLIRMPCRFNPAPGDRIFVADVAPSARVHDWVAWAPLTEIGRVTPPEAHEHPPGQIVGLVDWLKQYEAWMGDHQARLDAADKQIAEGKTQIDAARKDLTQAQSDIAAGVREAALERARLDAAEARLDQTNRDLLAAGTRIGANETALAGAQKRLESAETIVEKTTADLGVLEGTVGDVSAKAEASEQKALEALNRAGTAQAAADGKTTITRALEPRTTQPGTAVGDTHFTMSSMGGGGVVTRQQRWDGSTWQDESVGHQVLASLDLGKATVGELDGGRIRVGSISADRVMIGLGQNLVANPSGGRGIPEPHTAYYGGVKTGITGSTGGTVFYTNLTMGGWGDALVVKSGATAANGRVGDFVLDPRSQYVLRLRMKKVSGTGQGRVKINVYNIEGALLRNAFSPTQTMSDNWSNLEVRLSGADVAGGVSAGIVVQNPRDGEYWYEALDFRELGTGALFVDGSITGKQIEAHSVAGEIGQFLKVEAQSGTFTDSLTGRNARLLGETVAESINITGNLRGRDAILSGTVDVGQLNVTGAMSAKIILASDVNARRGFFTEGLTAQDAALLGTTVAEKLVVTDTFSARVVNAMTAQTKQLVVTEDAILNRATVVQSLVTPELIAQKADIGMLATRMITTGALQTSTAANRGVKIDGAGVRAWDDTGRQTVNLNGKNNVLTGTFQTAETRQRVRIAAGGTVAAADFYAGNDTDDHLGIWYNQTGTNILNAEANILAMLGTSHTADSPGLKMWPGRGAFTLQGRWWPDSTAMKFALFMLSAGLGAGYYQRVTLNYPTPFPTNNSIRFPFISVETRNGGDVIANIVSQTENGVEVNLINKSTDKATGVLYVRVMALNMAS